MVGRVLSISVPTKINFSLEPFVAQATTERFVTGVLSHVSNQIAALWERFTADDTLMRLLA